MANQLHGFRFYRILVFGLTISLSACSLFHNPDRLREQKERIEKKRQHYLALHRFVTAAASSQDLTTRQVRELYGEPDDIFRSGSAGSQLEIWTYEKISASQDEEFWDNIRLYFNNSRLMSWKF